MTKMKRAVIAWTLGLGLWACGGAPVEQQNLAAETASELASNPGPVDACRPTGCSGTICSDEEVQIGTCEWREEYRCYAASRCERQADGACGWSDREALDACLGQVSPPGEGNPPQPACVRAGCSGNLCVEEGTTEVGTCEWNEDDARYENATCERQPDGACGWTFPSAP